MKLNIILDSYTLLCLFVLSSELIQLFSFLFFSFLFFPIYSIKLLMVLPLWYKYFFLLTPDGKTAMLQ